MPFTNYFGNKVLDILRGTSFIAPTAVYVSLHTADPGETGASEVTGGGYTRMLVTFTAPANKQMSNAADIEFDNLPACTVTHFGLWDAQTGGTFLWGGALTVSKTVQAGDALRFKAGDLDVILDPA